MRLPNDRVGCEKLLAPRIPLPFQYPARNRQGVAMYGCILERRLAVRSVGAGIRLPLSEREREPGLDVFVLGLLPVDARKVDHSAGGHDEVCRCRSRLIRMSPWEKSIGRRRRPVRRPRVGSPCLGVHASFSCRLTRLAWRPAYRPGGGPIRPSGTCG